MADFLDRLIDKTFERGPKLERRRPAMFEPALGVPVESRPAQPEVEEVVDEVETPARVMKRARTAPQYPPPQPEMEDSGERPAELSRDARAQTPPPGRSHTGAGDPRRPAGIQPVEFEPVAQPSPVVHGPVLDRSIESIRRVQRLEYERVITEEHRTVERIPVERVVRQEARLDRTIMIPVPAAAREIEVRSSTPPSPRIRPAREAGNPAAPGKRDSQMPPPAAPVPVPTITVSIGRVEIRAAPPAPSPRQSRPAAPKLGLEAYLRGRTGGVQ